MDVNRRKVIGTLTAGAVAAGIAEGQTASPVSQSAVTPDAELEAVRQGRRFDAQRIAAVKLPQATEPAFRFRA